MVVVSAIFAVVAIPAVVVFTIIRGLAAAHRQEYREDMSALAFASASQGLATKRKHPEAQQRPMQAAKHPALNHGRAHSALALR